MAGVLDPEYELAIMNFRESHRGTLLGMTRFRDVIDDMPMVGFGLGALYNDRVESFHSALAGHSANYLSRGNPPKLQIQMSRYPRYFVGVYSFGFVV